MAQNVIDVLIELAWSSTGPDSFIEAINARMPLDQAKKAVSYEFGTLDEFYQWTCRNTTPPDFESTVVKGTMPVMKEQKKADPVSRPYESQELHKECEDLRESLADALTELQELVKTIVPQLDTLYTATVGVPECDLFSLQCENMQRKRILDLLQVCLNRGIKPDMEGIRKKISQESKNWSDKIEIQRQTISSAKARLSSPESHRKGKEFKKLFRILIRKLHPELNPFQNEAERMLWFKLQSAYEKGGPEALNDISLLAEHIGDSPLLPEKAGIEAWKRCRKDLTTKLWDIESQIEHIKMSFPYTLKDHLINESWIQDRNRLTELKIAEEKKRKESLQAEIERIESRIKEL
ncbi:MAG: hypothetical protein AB9903_13150 [Vulcanimicrobiota bacterium]